jgi:competence protein ComEA
MYRPASSGMSGNEQGASMKRFLLVLMMLGVTAGIAGAAVNINTATKEELTSIKGVGDKRAQDIIDYRAKNGPFKSIDDLEKVPGIGPGFMKRIRSQITTSGKTATDKPAKAGNQGKVSAIKVEAAKSQGLRSDKASGKIAENLTTGAKAGEKKTK